jgi:autoinducer 2 (AI-2) kinase
MCGLKPNVFPEVHESGSIIGKVTKKAAEDTGLKEDTPVVVGGADTQLGLLGIGVTDVNRVTVVGGSFWQQTILLDKPLIDRKIRLRTLCYALPNLWMMEGIGFYCGLTMRWFRDAFCQSEIAEAKKNGTDTYSVMEREGGKAPPGSNGVLAIFSNVMNSRKWIHAPPSFLGFDITNPKSSGKKECIRAIEESAGYVSKGHLSIIESIVGRKVKEIVFTGGGAKGFLWPQILADVLNVRVRVPVVKESTALGAAICAGVGAGFYQNLFDAAKQLARVEKEFQPSKDAHKTYERLYQNWRKVYDESLRTAEKGLMKPLWRASGA